MTASVAVAWENFGVIRRQMGRPFVIAHRGAQTREPENSWPAFQLALEQGADGLETDLRFSRDGEIMLFHDPTLERMSVATGPLARHTATELQQLRMRHPNGSLAATAIPTLAELIERTAAQVPLLLELKDPLFLQPVYAQKLVDLLRTTGVSKRTALVSFHFEHVQAVQALAPEIPTGHITMKNPWPQKRAQLLGPVWPLLYANPLYVAMAHRFGSIVAPLDPAPIPRLRYYLRLGVDALLADEPDAVLAALHTLQPT
jgi:glycerophosphoryl diester phosphodiesterase